MAPAIANGHTSNNGNRAEGGNAGNPDRPALRYWRNKLSTLLDDESENHRILGTAYLTAYGVETRSVSNGRAAMELIFSGARFSLILIDMHMRCMSGAQCVSHLRTMGVRSPILGMTTFCREIEEHAFLAAGGNGFIPKPLMACLLTWNGNVNESEFIPMEFIPNTYSPLGNQTPDIQE